MVHFPQKPRILITGGAGFIGSNLAERLQMENYQIGIIDDFSTGKKENIPSGVKYIRKNINSIGICNLRQWDIVIHLAAIPRVAKSIEEPLETNRANIDGTLKMLELSRRAGVKQFIYASSSSVYGMPIGLPMKEDMPCKPKSPYGLQKLAAEEYCRLFWEIHKFPTVALRFFNVYGKRMDMDSDYSTVIGKFITQKKRGNPFTIYGDGNQTRDFTNVQDVVRAIMLCIGNQQVSGEAINIGAGHNISVNQIADLIDKDWRKEYIVPNPRPNEPHDTLADISKAEKLLSWKPFIELNEETIKEI